MAGLCASQQGNEVGQNILRSECKITIEVMLRYNYVKFQKTSLNIATNDDIENVYSTTEKMAVNPELDFSIRDLKE